MEDRLSNETMVHSMPTEDESGAIVSAAADPVMRLRIFLRRRRAVFVLTSVLGIGIAAIFDLFLPTLYTAQAVIEVQRDRSAEYRVQTSASSSNEVDSARIETEIEILRSQALALEVINKLGLGKDLQFVQCAPSKACDPARSVDRGIVVEQFRRRVSVSRVGRTHLVQIQASSKERTQSSLIANTLVSSYIDWSRQDTSANTPSGTSWVDGQLEELKERVDSSKHRMHILQQQVGIGETSGGTGTTSSELDERKHNLLDAERNRSIKEAHAQAISSAAPIVADLMAGLTDALESQRKTLQQKREELASLSQTYGSAYPPILELKAQIEYLERSVASSESAQVDRAKKDQEAARSHEDSMHSELQDSERRSLARNSAILEYESARKEYEANHDLYLGLLERVEENHIVGGFRSGAIRVVDLAAEPAHPSSPRILLNLSIGLVSGLCFGFFLAAVYEVVYLDAVIESRAEEGRVTSLDAHAVWPANVQQPMEWVDRES